MKMTYTKISKEIAKYFTRDLEFYINHNPQLDTAFGGEAELKWKCRDDDQFLMFIGDLIDSYEKNFKVKGDVWSKLEVNLKEAK